ncbi:hypothetical protein Paes_2341 (plasmid) [Prosthecochloris aestuarii DSM 271]|uniref:Uncharacterized protein n=1 Tax=Prosthecochloris aestuarii (strain DSM 271 / SK 413) TaxID=290512 RepID=B4S9K5_PROA2|nr:hypothetical protein [Prosthecochloris aestuarii]ACF47332.1 hypothetical protein Paes_2341 [Prosthecochloris aestuarii DSM 271]
MTFSPMATAIQLRGDDDLTTSIFYGMSDRIRSAALGDVALIQGSETVLYVISGQYRNRAFLFRTGVVKGRDTIPGVYPDVQLLVSARTRTMVHRLQTSVKWLKSKGIDLNTLDDDFYARLQARIEEKKFSIAFIQKLLNR